MKAKLLLTATIGFVFVAVFVGCAKVPKDDAQLTEAKFDNLMGTRYT